MNKIISINEIIEWNHVLAEQKIDCKIHLRDACGGQSFYITLGEDSTKDDIDNLKQSITEIIEQKGVQIQFLEKQLDFIIKN